MLFRHGDVLIQKVNEIPPGAKSLNHRTLAHGELTGHSHQIREQDNVLLWEAGPELFLEIAAPRATVVHQEHAEIELPQGKYRVWRQREYTPERIVVVRD
ncbi:conserved hypothetical protein [Pirellula staleyi DSM 6068]|uniref:Uncharacterized protein n=1 Tax=Pirellula staleyi (strain ATCC 27377 / DSM 6068 / ICPB 4128) TaxID=530564 RepID=D2R0G8_PIRSD|nr:hypothetical protein [Pirellula staleyi]ADB14836.1 conserved hypothetical protein [Pirellula staleyi DSM 6068]